MEAIVGEAGLGPSDRRALEIGAELERTFLHQGRERRSIEETIAIGWRLIERLPRSDLLRISDATWERHHG
jgi:V/A-type H+-transporting ATPase subunit B